MPRARGLPQEVFIGIAYARASAAAILAMRKDTLVGNILAACGGKMGWTALLYGALGLFHYVFRERFLLMSRDPEERKPAAC
jgi:zinc/manganese transport system permease protein